MDFYDKRMVERYEQVELFSAGEYRRRIDGIRQIMKEQGVGCTIFIECAEEAVDFWFTGAMPLEYVIVPERGDVLAVLWDEVDESAFKLTNSTDYRRYLMQRRKPQAPCDGVTFINRMTDETITDIVASFKADRIGLVLPWRINAGLYDALTRKCPGAELVDVTIPMMVFKAIKSDEEIYAIKQSAAVQGKVFEALPQMIRVGRTCASVNTEMAYLLGELGASGVVHCNLSDKGPQDVPCVGFGDPNKAIEYGERLYVMFEANGPGHQHVAFGRYFTMGEPTKSYQRAIDIAIQTHNYAVGLMKPNTMTLHEIAHATRRYCNYLGLTLMERVGWNWMHSMGAYYYEQLSVEDYTENIPFPSNVVLHCHPVTYRTFPEYPGVLEDQVMLNTYLITQEGAQDLCGQPLDLVVLD